MAFQMAADFTKWPKDFPELKIIDDLLRCGICYGYIKTCMVTSCSHNYCSLCIRKSLQYKQQCPACFEDAFEPSLRNNRVVDRFVELFSGIRDKLLRHLRIADLHLPQHDVDRLPLCIKNEQSSPVPSTNAFKKGKGESSNKYGSLSTANIERPSVSRRLDGDLVSPPHHEESLPTIPKMFLSPKKQSEVKPKQNIDVPTVPCPVCEVDIPERNINIHLDSCLMRSEKPASKSPEKKKKRSPLAKMVYSMMSDKDLRKRLKEHGLNTQGDKKTLINRIQRFTILYNSECDSDDPRPVVDIIRQIEREENGEKKNVAVLLTQPRLPVLNRKTDPKIIEMENKKYLNENKDSFAALINAVRQREKRPIRTKARGTLIESDDSEIDEPKTTEITPICEEQHSSTNEKENEYVLINGKKRGISLKRTKNMLTDNASDECSSDSDNDCIDGENGNRDKNNMIQNGEHSEGSKNVNSLFELRSEDEMSEEYPPSSPILNMKTPSRNSSLIAGSSSTKKRQLQNEEGEGTLPKVNVPCRTDLEPTQLLISDSETDVPSPSVIVPEEDQSESQYLGEETEQFNVSLLKDSQMDDPDFVLLTEDLEQDSEEIYLPIRRSRKNIIEDDSDQGSSDDMFIQTRHSKRKLTTPSPDLETESPSGRSRRNAKTPNTNSTSSNTKRSLRKRAKH